jgi:hypothetical protein
MKGRRGKLVLESVKGEGGTSSHSQHILCVSAKHLLGCEGTTL